MEQFNRTLTDEEFINQLTKERVASPLIDALCTRFEIVLDMLEASPLSTAVKEELDVILSCPICRAELNIQITPETVSLGSNSAVCEDRNIVAF